MSTVDAAIINHITNGGSSGGGGSGVSYTAGDAISLANNQISVQYDTNTMELINGKLSAKSGSSGGGGSSGNVPTEDVYTKVCDFELGGSSTYLYIYNNVSIKTGDIVKIRMKDNDLINEYIIIRNSEEELYNAAMGGDQSNIILLNRKNDDIVRGLYNKPDGISYKTISIPCEVGSVHEDQTGDDVGLFSTSQLSYNTLVRIMQNYYRTQK